MKQNNINAMKSEEMILRYMNSRTSDFDWSVPSSITPANSKAKMGSVQKAVLHEAGVLR
ncbi:hypothetical protein [Dubosiella newyorkensis]|jgi:hypothetical protein|uniref:hypothetical protein n=1 Tax=Dubosiella newyorkensis TaxID=1862672 RepID=UPI0013017076|nr:hypothetical protein [Dubosiella newyorkensis]MCI9040459.1 hypothetical protein [Dubosiella newyorkensis]